MRNLKILSVLMIPLLLASSVFIVQSPAETVKAGNLVSYSLYATDAYVWMADGTTVYNYGFVGGRTGQPLTYMSSVGDGDDELETIDSLPPPTPGAITDTEALLAGDAQFPAPVIYASVGDVVEIRLKNLGTTNADAPNDPHSIHLHGVDVGAANDGVPETSVGAIPANSDVPGAGNVVVYMFTAKNAGTYMYHCHQEADIHVQMGMYGALIIYNPTDEAAASGPGQGKGGTLWGWKYDKDYVILMSEVAVAQHTAEEISSSDYNPVDFHPQYWLINGLSFPNTIHVGGPGFNWNDWIAAHQGYDPFIIGSISTKHPARMRTTNGDKVLIRMINMGFESQPMHMHGFHGKVIGSDQRPFGWSFGNMKVNDGMEKQTMLIGSGETYEWLVDFGQQSMAVSTYPPDTQTRYDASGNPVNNTETGNPAIVWGDTQYIGGPQVSGAAGLPLSGQLFPFHNHDDYKATNNGVYPGGQFTMLMTLP